MRTHRCCPTGTAVAMPGVRRGAIESGRELSGRPVKVIVPYAAGAAADVIGRIVAQSLSEHTGTQFYVENLPGAGSVTGTVAAARAPADGHTILVMNFRTSSCSRWSIEGPLQSVQELHAGRIHCDCARDDFGPSVGAGQQHDGTLHVDEGQSRQI